MRVDLPGAPYAGMARSYVTVRGRARYPNCARCGSSLATRLEAVRTVCSRVIDTYRCPCGRGRHITRGAIG
jgi:hypothetical protein